MQALYIVLDYVERWNKQDKEKSVAYAAEKLTTEFPRYNE